MLPFAKTALADVVASTATQSLGAALQSVAVSQHFLTGIPKISIVPPAFDPARKGIYNTASAILTTAFHKSRIASSIVACSLVETLIDELAEIAVAYAKSGYLHFDYANCLQRFTSSVVASYTTRKMGGEPTFSKSFVAGAAGEVCAYIALYLATGKNAALIDVKKTLSAGVLRGFYGYIYGTILK